MIWVELLSFEIFEIEFYTKTTMYAKKNVVDPK